MRRPAGHILLDDKEVADTAQCVHCAAHFIVKKGSGKKRGYCMNCAGVVCGPQCAECVPYEKKLEAIERRDANRLHR